REIIYVTPDDTVASWTANTHEFRHIQKRLRQLGVRMTAAHNLCRFAPGEATLACVYTGREQRIDCASVLAITARLPNDELQRSLLALEPQWRAAGIESVTAIGDCLAPGLIAHAVYAGHRYAREFDAPCIEGVPFQRRMPLQNE
ncbi:MAG TPA: hypothetical protein VKB34_08620, partial [Povalibacter sp.]|nr:hypothetical protein [Povalibacter sp.]